MTKEQAIKLLRKETSVDEINKLKQQGLNKEEVTDKIQEAMDMGADAIEKQTWISVNDRLPKDDEYVLIWCKGEFTNGTNMCEECEWYGIGYSYGLKWEVFQCKDIEDIEVLAWMPLPNKYISED